MSGIDFRRWLERRFFQIKGTKDFALSFEHLENYINQKLKEANLIVKSEESNPFRLTPSDFQDIHGMQKGYVNAWAELRNGFKEFRKIHEKQLSLLSDSDNGDKE